MDPNKESQVPGNDDEVNVLDTNAIDVQVEVVDDTPPEDRNRKPLDKDPLVEEDEAAQYTKGVKKRIGELTHKAHDERRARERAEREREEAIRFAKAANQRVRMLEQQMATGEAAFANTTTEKEELALANANDQYRKAYESGDPDAIAKATASIAAASQRLENAKFWKQQSAAKAQQIPLQQQDDGVDYNQQVANAQTQQQVDEPDDAAKSWAADNPWFGKDRKMTSFVYGIHEELVMEQGLHPVNDADEYYAAINAEMRKRFPDYEWSGGDDDVADKPQPAAKAKPRTTVAPVTRTTSGNGKKVTLTASEVRIAEQFGLTPEQYAREKLKLNGGS